MGRRVDVVFYIHLVPLVGSLKRDPTFLLPPSGGNVS